MYFLYKEGAYGHGVFWIGEQLEDGIKETDKAAALDKDSYHTWTLYEFRAQTDTNYYDGDAEHQEIYKKIKNTEKNNLP